MRLRSLLVLGMTLAAVPPLLLLGFAATQVATQALITRGADLHVKSAANLSTYVDTWFAAQIRSMLLLMETFNLSQLSDEGRVGFQRLIYSQFDDVNVVSLLTPEGADVAPSQRVTPSTQASLPARHEVVDDQRFHLFRSRLPLEDACSSVVTLAEPYTPPGASWPVVPVVLCGDGILLGVEVSLRKVVDQIQAQLSEGGEVAILGADARPFARAGASLVEPEHFRYFQGSGYSAHLRYSHPESGDVLAAVADVSTTGWLAVVAEPFSQATASVREIRWQAAWFGLVAVALAFVIAVHFSRRIHRPISLLQGASAELGRGDLGRQVPSDLGVRELDDLGRSFNTMSCALQGSQSRIQKQNEEIEAWNRELQARVEERTRELEEAQDRLVEQGRMVAVAEMGAGLAHELNNPMAGILGLAQVLKVRAVGSEVEPLAASIEEQAVRCTDILRTLRSFTEDTGAGERESVDLDMLLQEVVSLVSPSYRQRGITLERRPAGEPLFINADRPRLGRAMAWLLTSMASLVPSGGGLVASTHREGVRIQVALLLDGDGGPSGIGRDDWLASGLSLWVARRILGEHGGGLEEPAPGAPQRFLLTLPEA